MSDRIIVQKWPDEFKDLCAVNPMFYPAMPK
jgi:hypothetical protein